MQVEETWKETMREARVTYTLEMDGKFFIIENVPARVCEETGEQFFSPETVERLQQTIWGREKPKKIIETPVYEFAA
jgi:YgiT-type zinc finger domain-containing protein